MDSGRDHLDVANDQVAAENSVDKQGAERLRQAVDLAGGTAQVSRLSGVPPGTLKSYLRGRDMRRGSVVALADATGVSLEWLAAGRGSMVATHEVVATHHEPDTQHKLTPAALVPTGYVAIPRYNVSASAGDGALSDNPQIVEYLAFHEDYLRNTLRRSDKNLILIVARGSSMEPTIRDGDILTVDITPDQVIEHDKLYVLRVGENLLVKRIERRLTTLVLHSDNPRYSPETIPATDQHQLHLLGQVMLVTTPPR